MIGSRPTMVPPPTAIDSRSGIRNRVRTPPISTTLLASRGKPLTRQPMSAVVPPTSQTMAFSIPASRAAPRMELVGPEAKENTGYSRAASASATVPSFWVM